MKVTWYSILITLVIMQYSCKIKPKSAEEIAKETRNAVVVIKCYNNRDSLFGEGTGFFVSKNEIVTNRHVVEFANRVEIFSASQKVYLITYVTGYSENTDIIKLGVDTRDDRISTVTISKSEPRVGENIVVVGSPLGLSGSVSEGIISAVRSISEYGNVIQITAPISYGSSGSPVFNDIGEVIGVATSYIPRGQNINFALPVIVLQDMKTKNLLSLSEWNRQYQYEIRHRSLQEKIRLANIRLATVWEHTKNDIVNEDAKKQQVSYYDLRGNEIEHIKYNADETIEFRKVLQYDTNGNLVEQIEYDSNETVKFRKGKRYDTNGRLVEEISYSIENIPNYKLSYVYDRNGKNSKRIGILGEDTSWIEHLEYDNNGLLVGIKPYDVDEKQTHSVIYKYNGNGRLTEELNYDTQGNIAMRFYNKYDAKGNHVESGREIDGKKRSDELFHYNEEGVMINHTVRSYDIYGKISSNCNNYYDEFEQITKSITTVKFGGRLYKGITGTVYDFLGNKTEEIHELVGVSLSRKLYKYDKWGNLKETIYFNENGEIIYRVFIQYEYY